MPDPKQRPSLIEDAVESLRELRRLAGSVASFVLRPAAQRWGGVAGVVIARARRAYGSVPKMVGLALFAVVLIGVPFYPDTPGVSGIPGIGVLGEDRYLVIWRLVGLFIMLGIGLNIVVGYAGLLDLGYVAFFASGAYLFAIFASPASPLVLEGNTVVAGLEPTLSIFWLALPLALLFGTVVGILLGVPVLPLRGDYLAIVTLGFGEIIRLFLINKKDFTNGSQGLYGIRPPDIPDLPIIETVDALTTGAQREWFFFVLAGAVLAAFCAARLRDSRMGRAWEAIREDEEVAAAMGVSTVKYKLLAFSMGAAIGAFGGAIFAAFQGAAIPSSFTLLVSINVISLVVIGGMGSTPGVVLGAFILIGIPDILRQPEAADFLGLFGFILEPVLYFFDFTLGGVIDVAFGTRDIPTNADELAGWLNRNRFVVYGALLVTIIVLRPAGLIPSGRRKIEFAAAEEEAAEA